MYNASGPLFRIIIYTRKIPQSSLGLGEIERALQASGQKFKQIVDPPAASGSVMDNSADRLDWYKPKARWSSTVGTGIQYPPYGLPHGQYAGFAHCVCSARRRMDQL